jgi:hypothetical protein
LGENGAYHYLNWSNEGIAERVMGTLSDGTPICRRPVFDIDVRAEKKDPYTRLSHNETLKDLYKMGVFEPENAAAAGILLSAMDFSGIGRLREQVAAAAQKSQGGEGARAGQHVPVRVDPLEKAYEEAEALRRRAEGMLQ